MATSTLLAALQDRRVIGTLPPAVTGVSVDSRRVEAGHCFVAVPGLRQDGRRFAGEAVRRGAALVVTEGAPVADLTVPQVVVTSARAAVGRLADAWYGHPSRHMTVVGITGTNGKTTTSYLVQALLRAAGLSAGVIGTIQYLVGDEARPAGQTTPEPLELHGLLAAMRERGVGGVAIEVSSHALSLQRADELALDVAVFTNLTQDHLDFHGTLDGYRRAKRHLFERLEASPKPRRTAVVSADDPAGPAMVEGLSVPVLTFGLRPGASVRALDHVSTLDGIRLVADTPGGRVTLASPLIGDHNVMNLLGAVAVGVALDLGPAAIAAALGPVGSVPGRFERVEAGQRFLVVVDYAHTPDALERVLVTARRLTPARLGVVFGCGGDRDRGKRPLMGEIAARRADRLWVTSDNPRSESPAAIVEEIVDGVRRVAGSEERWEAEPDRRAAIGRALRWAGAGDTVVIAGKGHETYQIIGSATLPFDDRVVAREILKECRTPGAPCPCPR